MFAPHFSVVNHQFIFDIRFKSVKTCAKMSRVRRQHNYRQLSEFERGHIIGLYEVGIVFHDIARRVERNMINIIWCWRSWSEKGRTIGEGAPSLEWRQSEKRGAFLEEIDHRITMRSLYHWIGSYRLISYRPRLLFRLTNLHGIHGLKWCNARAN